MSKEKNVKEKLTFLIKPETKKLWKKYALEHDITVTELIKTAVKTYIEN